MVENAGYFFALVGLVLMLVFRKRSPSASKFFAWVFGVGSGLIIAAVWVNLLIADMFIP